MLALELLLGVGLVILHRNVSLGLSFLISVAGVFILAPICGYIAFSSATMWMNFIPIIVAVLIHQLYDNAEEYRKLLAAQAQAGKSAHASLDSSGTDAEKKPSASNREQAPTVAPSSPNSPESQTLTSATSSHAPSDHARSPDQQIIG